MNELYSIADNYQSIIRAIDRGEFTREELQDTLDGAVGSFEEKAQAVLAYTESISADIEQVDQAIKRLQQRKKTLNNKKETMRHYLKENMQRTGITNIKCPLFNITLAKGRDKVVVDDLSLVPTEYIDVDVIQKPNKNEILKVMKNGDDVCGCHIEKGDETLRIT